MDNANNDKRHALYAANLVNKAASGAIETLRTMNLNNIRIVSRAAKDLKDPNPLSSTMMAMTTRFPIKIDSEIAAKYNVPKEFLGSKDGRTMGSTQCKLEAIDWWVNHSKVPEEGTKKVIEALTAKNRREVSDYFSIDWKSTRIVPGMSILERKFTPTQKPLVDIPKKYRIPALLQVIAPNMVTPHEDVSPFMIKELEKLKDVSIAHKISFAQQSRILLDAMDAKIKMLPCTSGCIDTTGPFRYAVQQNHFTITNIKILNIISKSDELRAQLHNVCKVCTKALQDGLDPESVIECIIRMSIIGTTVAEALDNEEIPDTVYSCAIKALLGKKVSHLSQLRGTTFSPNSSNQSIQVKVNKSGFKFNEYHGLESVDFKNGETRGSFTHDGPYINEIIINIIITY